jgi:heme/copper-type cytochrome/quinol oxidase subunit 3
LKKVKKKVGIKKKKIETKLEGTEEREEHSTKQALSIVLSAVVIFALFLILFIHLSNVKSNAQQASIVKVNESEDFEKQIYTRPTTIIKVIYNKKT